MLGLTIVSAQHHSARVKGGSQSSHRTLALRPDDQDPSLRPRPGMSRALCPHRRSGRRHPPGRTSHWRHTFWACHCRYRLWRRPLPAGDCPRNRPCRHPQQSLARQHVSARWASLHSATSHRMLLLKTQV